MLKKFSDTLIKVVSFYTATLLIVTLVVATADVSLRLLLTRTIPSAHPIMIFSMVIMSFSATGVAILERNHIGITIVFEKLKGRTKKVVGFINDLLILASCVLVTFAGIQWTLFLFKQHVTTNAGQFWVPFWIITFLSIVVGMFAASLCALAVLIQGLKISEVREDT